MCRSSEGARRRGGRCDDSRLAESAAHVLGMGLSSYDEQRREASRGPRTIIGRPSIRSFDYRTYRGLQKSHVTS
jgi:hypothetical protein